RERLPPPLSARVDATDVARPRGRRVGLRLHPAADRLPAPALVPAPARAPRSARAPHQLLESLLPAPGHLPPEAGGRPLLGRAPRGPRPLRDGPLPRRPGDLA